MATPARLTVRTRLLPDPPLWCWEIVDSVTGEVSESCWERESIAFRSPEDALRSGRLELIRIAAARPGARLVSRRLPPEPDTPSSRSA